MTTALATKETQAMDAVTVEEKLFALAQRKAKIYSESTLVPKEYQHNIGNVLIAENMAHRMGADTLMVMQNLYVVHGRPGWSSQFLIATFNSNERFSAIKYRFRGEPHTPEWGCQAYCTEIATGEEIAGTWVTWQMAQSEGWVNKNGSKWKTMPEQMFRYRSAAFLIRTTAPEIGMGLMTKDELEDMGPNGMAAAAASAPSVGLSGVKDRLLGRNGDADSDTVDGEVVQDENPGSDAPDAPETVQEPETPTEAPAEPESEPEEAESEEPPASELTFEEAKAIVDEKIAAMDAKVVKTVLGGRKVEGMDRKALTFLISELDKAS